MTRAEVCLEGHPKREVNTEGVKREEIDTDLEGEEAEKVVDLVNNYKDLVARNMKLIGCTDLLEMDIQLAEDKPVFYRPYRMSYKEREQVREIVRELKDADIVEECDSPFASNVILVRKINGAVRLCVDYRSLNKITVKQHYPLPNIDDQI